MVFEKIRAIICEQLSIGEDEVNPETLLSDLGADSLDMIDIAMSLEDEFNVEVPDEVLEKVFAVSDFVNYIEEH